jgi:hypothetical protein
MDRELLLSPEDQQVFWSKIDPDMRSLLELLEANENWIVKYEDMPDEFKEVSRLLPELVVIDPTPEVDDIITRLVYIIGNMPFRQSMSAVSWMNFMSSEKSMYGWGTILHYRCLMILSGSDTSPEIKGLATIICERIKIIILLNIHQDLFINPDISVWTDLI